VKVALLRNIAWSTSNLCRGRPSPPIARTQALIPYLVRLIHISDPEVITDACWALSYISDGPTVNIDAVLNAGALDRVLELLRNESNPTILTPALRVVGNVCTGSDTQTQMVIDGGGPGVFYRLLDSSRKALQKETCWAISNITAGTSQQIQSIIDANVVPKLFEKLKHDAFDVQKEAAWAIANITSGGSSAQLGYLVSLGCVGAFAGFLQSFAGVEQITRVALDMMSNILAWAQRENRLVELTQEFREYDVLDALANIAETGSTDLSNRAVRLLENYFPDDEEEEADGQ
jgi:importin subunit alpha-6/7